MQPAIVPASFDTWGSADSPSDGFSVQALRNTRLPRRLRMAKSPPSTTSRNPRVLVALALSGWVWLPIASQALSPQTVIRAAAVEVAPRERRDQAPPTVRLPQGADELADGHSILRGGEDRISLSIYPSAPPKNFELNLALKPAFTKAEAGIALRLRTARDYYLVQVDAAANTVAFDRIIDGKSEQIARAEPEIAVDEWHALQIRAEDERFTVSLDGKWLFTAYDATLRRAGRLALWTRAGSVTRIDHIAIVPLPEQR